MKKLVWTALFLTLSTSFVVGCGSDNENKANNNYYDDGYGRNPYDRRGYGTYSTNQVILSGRVEVTDSDAYQKYLKGIGACLSFWNDTCGWVDDNPVLKITVADYKFSDGNSSRGTVELMTQSGPAPYQVRWRVIDNNSGFDTKVLGNMGTKSWNKPLHVRITGRSTDSTVKADLLYNGRTIGYAYLDRMNR